ncbi:sensor histidine kinase [Catenulispora sp. GAS73]|uniref:sensor histidine kinase n=1 Tax=Catenulispora sp. GAS73 TaxID=3156269 RepID=UPI0035132AEC
MFVYVTLQRRRFPFFADLLYAAVLLTLTVLGSIGESHPTRGDSLPGWAVAPVAAYFLVGAASVALFWRYRNPLATLTATLVCTLTYTAFGYENGAALLNPMCALYTVVVIAWRPTTPGGSVRAVRTALIATGVTFTTLAVVTAAHNPFGAIGGSFVLIPGEVAVAFFAGLAVANQRAYVDAIRQRAEDAERSREDEARRRVDAERLRIARELHDVVAHTMSTINLQAGVAVHVSRDSPDLPEPVATALSTIRDASKNGLRELRAILAVLRQADDAEPSAPTAPTPDLDGLPALLDTVRASGLPVTVEITGERCRLPAAVELAAYRIVQESLTNTLRHAGPANATVRIRYGDEDLDVCVTDDGVGAGAGAGAGRGTSVGTESTGSDTLHGSGHGLIGMRERALATGGTLQAHPGPVGGFLVRARLPLGKETA